MKPVLDLTRTGNVGPQASSSYLALRISI